MRVGRFVVRVACAGAVALSGLAVNGAPAQAATPCKYYYDQSAYWQVQAANEYGVAEYYREIGDYAQQSDHLDLASVATAWYVDYFQMYRNCILEP